MTARKRSSHRPVDKEARCRTAQGRSGVGAQLLFSGDLWRCRPENQPPALGRVIEFGPGQFDLFQFPKALLAEGLNSDFIAVLVGMRAELNVDLLPGQGKILSEGEGFGR